MLKQPVRASLSRETGRGEKLGKNPPPGKNGAHGLRARRLRTASVGTEAVRSLRKWQTICIAPSAGALVGQAMKDSKESSEKTTPSRSSWKRPSSTGAAGASTSLSS